MVQAFGLGLVLSALYLRTGSLLWAMLFHFGLDTAVMIVALAPHATGATGVSLSDLMPVVVYLIITAILLRPSRWADGSSHNAVSTPRFEPRNHVSKTPVP